MVELRLFDRVVMFDRAVRVVTQLIERQRLAAYCLQGLKLGGDGFVLEEISPQVLLFFAMAIYQLGILLTLAKQPKAIRECPRRLGWLYQCLIKRFCL